jgi:hypothetical protein
MKRSEVRAFIKSGVDAIAPSIPFNSGRISEFNSERSNEYPFIWLESLSSSVELLDSGLPYDAWSIALHIAKKDAAGSSPAEYETIVDQCDFIGQQLVKQYNAIVSGYTTVTLDGITRDPFIHRHADDLTGIILSFTLNAPDTTNLC